MKPLLAILACILLASCSDMVPPRAIIAPETVISAVDTAPTEDATRKVDDASEKVSEANRKASEANRKALTTSAQLKAAMERARILAEGQELLNQAWQDAEAFAAQLGNELIETKQALEEAQTESDGLKAAVKALDSEVSILKSNAAVNKTSTAAIQAENNTLRSQAEKGNAARDDLLTLRATSKQKIDTLTGWLWKVGIAAALFATTTALLAYLLLKP